MKYQRYLTSDQFNERNIISNRAKYSLEFLIFNQIISQRKKKGKYITEIELNMLFFLMKKK